MRAWLQQRFEPSAWSIGATVLVLYAQLAGGGWLDHVALFTLGLLVAQLARAPRWVIYALLLAAFAITIANDVFVLSTGQQDPGADRDDAVEIAARSLLHIHNPWTKHTPLHNPISTGPSSILVAAPFVALTGHIDVLTFLFWLAVAVCAVAGDRLRGRDAAIVVVQLLQIGAFDTHTMRYWALDELAFAMLLFVPAWYFAGKRRYGLVGAFLAAALLWRLSYALPIVAFACWLRWEHGASWREMRRAFIGGVIATLAILAPFVVLFAGTIGHANPLGIALDKAAWPVDGGSDLTRALGWLWQHVPAAVVGPLRIVLAALLVVGLSRLLAKVRSGTPFVALTCANFIAFTFVHYAGRFADNFTGPIVIAAVLAIAFSVTPQQLGDAR